MPQVFIEAVAYLIGYGTAATVIGTALFYAATLAVTSAYANQQRRRAEREAEGAAAAELADRLVMTPLTGGKRSRIYGRVRNVDGVIFKATRGANSEFYTLVISLCGHEVDAIETVYFGDVPVTLDGSGYVTTDPYSKTTTESDGASQTFAVAGAHTIAIAHTPIGGSISVVQVIGDVMNGQIFENLSFSVTGTTNVNFTTTQPDATVTVAYQWTKTVSKARVRKFLGGAAQDLSGILVPLFPSLLTSSDRFAGDACLLVDLEYDRDVFPGGVPSISAVIRGAKVYDQRKDSTAGGSGAHRLANPATWQWTENNALCARDWAYYPYGGDMLPGTLNAQDVIDAANACDVSHTFTTDGGSTVRPMFTCGMVCRSEDPSQDFDAMVKAMGGKWGWSGGTLRMRAGAYRAPVRTITESWISDKAAINIVPEAPVDQAINIIRPTISDAAQAYAAAPAPDVRAEAYITVDTRELPQPITYKAITDTDHAQHVASIELKEQRSGLVATIPCNYRALELEYLDPIQVDLPYYGWDDKVFEIVEYEFSAEGGAVLTIKEIGPSIWDPDAEFTENDATPNTNLPNPFNVPVPTGLATDSGTDWLLRQADGTITSRLHVSWTPITDAAVVNGGAIEVRFGPADVPEAQWTSFEVPGGDSQITIPGVLDGRYYLVKVRARNALVRGRWSLYALERIVGKTAAPANVAGLTATIVQNGVRFDWTANSEADYAFTELRLGPTWVTATPIFRGATNTYTWIAPPVGTYTITAKHADTSDNESVTAASVAVVVDAAAAVQWANINGRPFDTINLIQTPFFEGGSRRAWNSGVVVAVAGHDWTKALQLSQRDTLEIGGDVPVRAGELIYGAADFDTSGTSFPCSLGFFCKDATGTVINYVTCCTLAAGNAWTRVVGAAAVPAGTVSIIPWIQINGFSGFGTLLAANLFLSRAVPTHQIVPGAVTAVHISTPTPVTVTGKYRTFNNGLGTWATNDTWTDLTGFTITPDVTCDALLTLNGYAVVELTGNSTNGGGSAGWDHLAVAFALSYSINGGSKTNRSWFDIAADNGFAYNAPLSYSTRVSFTAGVPITVTVHAQKTFSGDTMSVSQIELRLEEIKR